MRNPRIIASLGTSELNDEPKIFISHAHADVALAKLVRGTLIHGGVPHGRVFYSSSRSTGIPTGDDVVGHLKAQLLQASLVIELISPTFITRPMCLMELGGAWTLGTSTFPVVVPPLSRAQAVAAIGSFQMADLNDDLRTSGLWDELNDRIETALGIQIKATAWGEAVTDFYEGFAAALAASAKATAETQTEPGREKPKLSSARSDDDRISISNDSVRGGKLFAEATNQDSVEHTATFTATFYDHDGGIVGTGNAVVTGIRPGQSKTLTVLSVPEHSRYKVDIGSVL